MKLKLRRGWNFTDWLSIENDRGRVLVDSLRDAVELSDAVRDGLSKAAIGEPFERDSKRWGVSIEATDAVVGDGWLMEIRSLDGAVVLHGLAEMQRTLDALAALRGKV